MTNNKPDYAAWRAQRMVYFAEHRAAAVIRSIDHTDFASAVWLHDMHAHIAYEGGTVLDSIATVGRGTGDHANDALTRTTVRACRTLRDAAHTAGTRMDNAIRKYA